MHLASISLSIGFASFPCENYGDSFGNIFMFVLILIQKKNHIKFNYSKFI